MRGYAFEAQGGKPHKKGPGEAEASAGALICQICHSVSLTAGEGEGTGCALPSIPLNLPPLEKLQSPETNSMNK